jgi:putative tryptophan/tyrosine transport system substrate-binding protein
MRRRRFFALVGGVASALPFGATAQLSDRTYRIALLGPMPRSDPLVPLWDELKHAGFVEGHNLVVDRDGVGVPVATFDTIAAELAKARPDAIVVIGAAAARAAEQMTQSIPIVAHVDDPVEAKLVTSLSRPGGNITGTDILAARLDAKRLEVLHETVPSARRIAILADHASQLSREEVATTATELGLELVKRELRTAAEIVSEIDALAAAQVSAINLLASPITSNPPATAVIVKRARELRLPTMHIWPEAVRAGALVAFGPTLDESLRLLAQQLVRVFNGASPASLPFIRPTKFELALNLKTAKTLGLTVPPSLVAQSDEVIE